MAITATTIGAAPIAAFVGGVYSDTYNTFGAGVQMIGLNLVAGNLYEIDGDGSLGDAYVRVFDALGNEVKANDDGFDSGEGAGLDFYTQLIANYTGTYYFAISNIESTEYDPFTTLGRTNPDNFISTVIGSLNVTDAGAFAGTFPDDNSTAITEGASGDESDVIATASRQIRVAYLTPTSVGSFDSEIGRFDLSKNDRLVIDVNGRATSDPIDTILRVFNGVGAQQALNDNTAFSTDSELVFTAGNTGSFFIGVSGLGNAGYNPIDGSGNAASDAGDVRVIVHVNPDIVGLRSVADTLVGDDGANYIVSLSGADSLTGGDGNDTLAGGDENDTLNGGNGRDVLYGEFNNDNLNGNRGNDVLVGGEGNDTIIGSEGSDILAGDDGNDSLSGGQRADTINGGAGEDSATGAEGADVLFGDAGNDTLRGGTQNDSMEGGDGNDSLFGDDNNDTMFGGAGLDVLTGGTGNDSVGGGNDADRIDGGEGNDALTGGSGDDTILGGLGADTLEGASGNDRLTGGTEPAVRDVFRFNSTADAIDTITDFQLNVDVIDLSAIFDATGSNVNGANLAQFVQASPAGGGGDSFLGVDANGLTGGLTFVIIAQVTGVTSGQLFDVDNFLL